MTEYRINYLPVRLPSKAPAVSSWKPYQTAYYPAAFQPFDPRGALCGHISGDLIAFDFDNGGEAFKPWAALVGDTLEKTYIESSPHGFHVLFRMDRQPDGNEKLARTAAGDVLIETRGEGGFIVTAPTPNYTPIMGDLDSLPVLTADEVENLFNAARAFNQYKSTPSTIRRPKTETVTAADNWIDLLRQNSRGFNWVAELLIAAGWTFIKETADGGVLFGHPAASDPRDNHIILHADGHVFCFGTGAKNRPFEGDETYSAADAIGLLLNGSLATVKREFFKRFPEFDHGSPAPTSLPVVDDEDETDVGQTLTTVGVPANKEIIKRILKAVAEDYPRLNALRVAALDNSPRPQPFLSLIPALSVVSGVSCRKLDLPNRQSLNLSFCAIAPSGGGKGALLDLISSAFDNMRRAPIGDDGQFIQDTRCRAIPLAKTAPEFVYNILDNPVAVFTADEFQDILGRDGRGYSGEVFKIFKEVSTKSHGVFTPSASVTMRRALEERQKRGGNIEVSNPAVGLFLGGTPSIFQNLSDADLKDGFVRRVIFYYNPIAPPAREQNSTLLSLSSSVEVSPDLKEWIANVSALDEFSIKVNNVTDDVVKFINRRQRENEDYLNQTATPPPLRLSYSETLQKLAIVLAFSRAEVGAPVTINLEDVQLADDLLEVSFNDFENGWKNSALKVSDFKKFDIGITQNILNVLQQSARGVSRFKLFDRYLKASVISARDFQSVIDALIACGSIYEDGDGRLYAAKKNK